MYFCRTITVRTDCVSSVTSDSPFDTSLAIVPLDSNRDFDYSCRPVTDADDSPTCNIVFDTAESHFFDLLYDLLECEKLNKKS